jgi:hypothetical protein
MIINERHISPRARALAAIIACGALAVGCGSQKPDKKPQPNKYDVKTEAVLKGTIRPRMVDLARKTIELAKKHPRSSFREQHRKDMRVVVGSEEARNANAIDVTISNDPGKRPKPGAVLSVSLKSFDRNEEHDIDLSAPGSSVEGNSHPDGWSAAECIDPDIDTEDQEPCLNSSDSGRPINTARKVLNEANLDYTFIVNTLEQPG